MAILIPLHPVSNTYPSTAADVFFPVSVHSHVVSRSRRRNCQLSDHQTPPLSPLQPLSRTERTDKSLLNVSESCSEAELWAAANLRTLGADFARAYLSNVCVANEFQRNGFGYELMAKAKSVAEAWGISDLYVHVAVDNEAAKNLYMKSGFTFESDEPGWQARFLDRPQRLLLWTALPITYEL